MKQILALILRSLRLFKAVVLGLRNKDKTTRVEIDSNHDGQPDVIVTVEHEHDAEATVERHDNEKESKYRPKE